MKPHKPKASRSSAKQPEKGNGFEKRLRMFLSKAGKNGLTMREAMTRCRATKAQSSAFREVIRKMKEEGELCEQRGRLVSTRALGYLAARIIRLGHGYGIAQTLSNQTDIYIGRGNLSGALQGDTVLIKLYRDSSGALPEAKIVNILKKGEGTFSGVVQYQGKHPGVVPDFLSSAWIPLDDGGADVHEGEKILAQVVSRGTDYSGHTARPVTVYGDAQRASSSALALLEQNGIRSKFPEEVLHDADYLNQQGIPPDEIQRRTDLRGETIFTIDSADSKDLDDAISLRRTETGYELAVHIADVSHYVRHGSAIDKEAFARGTSVYYADQVIPMLPPSLSNGICSLNPGEDRLAFSAILQVGRDGQLQDYRFEKTVIRSAVKGVYREINEILAGTASPEIAQKYERVKDSIPLMKELADILTSNKLRRGAPQIDTTESKIITDANGVCTDVRPRDRGQSEIIIEEFMLMANEAAAKLGQEGQLPFVYRVHEEPSREKLDALAEILGRVGLDASPLRKNVTPGTLASILEKVKDSPRKAIINKMVLRSMAKARYDESPLGHFGLVLSNYCHFTSPIRRYPDLTIHRILSDYLSDSSKKQLYSKYGDFVTDSAKHSSAAELSAMKTERMCEDCYKAEYMAQHIGEEFDAVIDGVSEFNLFVELPNTVSGAIRVENLPGGYYESDGVFEFREQATGRAFRVGDPIRVRCTAANISDGRIDFEPVEI